MPLRVAYDVSFVARARALGQTQTGVSRLIEEQLGALCRKSELELTVVGLTGGDRHPIRTSVEAQVYAEQGGFPNCRHAATHRSRFGLSRQYADRLLANARIVGKSRQGGPAAAKLKPWPIRAARRMLSYAVAVDAAQRFDADRFDVFHATYRPLPNRSLTRKLARVATVLDLIPTRTPEAVPRSVAREQDRVLKSIDRSRDMVLCISEHVRQELCEHLKIDPSQVHVCYLAASEKFQPIADNDLLARAQQRYAIPPAPYLLTVSNPQPRKNIPFLIRAFTRLLREQPRMTANLVLVGSRKLGWMNEETDRALEEAGELRHRIVFTGYVADSDFAAVYSAAMAFVFPSTSEGFGLPPLEAMACGLPVISSNATSLPEVVGNAGVLLDPHDSDGWCDAMLRLYRGQSLRQELSAKSLERAATFSWNRCATQTLAAYRSAAARGGG